MARQTYFSPSAGALGFRRSGEPGTKGKLGLSIKARNKKSPHTLEASWDSWVGMPAASELQGYPTRKTFCLSFWREGKC